MSIVTRARLERTKEEEALTHLSTERERERKSATGSSSSRLLLRRALCVTFWRRSLISSSSSIVRRRERCGLTTRLDRDGNLGLPFARARALDRAKKDTPSPPAVASLRETGDRRTPEPSVFCLCARCAHRETETERRRGQRARFQIRDKDLD